MLSRGDGAGRDATVVTWRSGRSSDAADVGPRLERTRPRGPVLAGGDVVAAEVEEVVDLLVGGEEALVGLAPLSGSPAGSVVGAAGALRLAAARPARR